MLKKGDSRTFEYEDYNTGSDHQNPGGKKSNPNKVVKHILLRQDPESPISRAG